MYKITLKGMLFYGFHGVLQAEKQLGQKFIIDIEIIVDKKIDTYSDKIENTINYADVYKIANKYATQKKFNLIETLAQSILDEIMNTYGEQDISAIVTVKKPQAPINGVFDYAQVEVRSENCGF